MLFDDVRYLWRQQQVVPGVDETFYDALSEQSSIHRLRDHQGHPVKTRFTRCDIWLVLCRGVNKRKARHFYLCGMSLGTSISRDFI